MATNDQKPANEVSKSLKAHKEPDRLAAHPEQARLEAYKEETDEIVPAATADVDETPVRSYLSRRFVSRDSAR